MSSNNSSSNQVESINEHRNDFVQIEGSTSEQRVNSTPSSNKNRKRKHSLITNDPKNALPQLTFLIMAEQEDSNEHGEGTQSPITNFQASPLFSYHYIEEEVGDQTNQSSSMHHNLEDLNSSVSSLSSLSSTQSSESVSSEPFDLNCTSTSLAILSKQKYDCEAAWKLRSALRDDASKIFQATWQEAERQKSILKKLVGSLKSFLDSRSIDDDDRRYQLTDTLPMSNHGSDTWLKLLSRSAISDSPYTCSRNARYRRDTTYA